MLLKKTIGRYIVGKGPVALAHINFIISLSLACLTTIWALFINSFVNNSSITGLISGLLSLVSFISYFVFIPLLNHKDKRKLFSASLVLFIIFYLMMFFANDIYTVIIIALLLTTMQTVRVSSFGVMLKNNSTNKELTEKEGLNWTFVNLGWVIGPLLAGYIANKFNVQSVFILCASLSLLAFMVFHMTKFRKERYYQGERINPVRNFKRLFQDKRRALAYTLTGGCHMWWMLIYVYLPLYAITFNLTTQKLGYLLLAIALPLIMLEHRFSKVSQIIGFKKIFMLGFTIPAFCALAAFFVSSFYLQVAFLILASTGIAMLEPTTEAYFLRVIKRDEAAHFFGPYATAKDVSQFISKVIPALLLIVLPFKFVFLSFAIFMGVMIGIASLVKD